jgi:hypothetical protein
MLTLLTTSEYYLITLCKSFTFSEIKQWNIKLDQIKICVLFEYKWKAVNISMLRTMTVLANCCLRRRIETRESEAERYVTRIMCWQQIVLGWWDKGWKECDGGEELEGGRVGKGERRENTGVGVKGWGISTHIVIYLLKNVDN